MHAGTDFLEMKRFDDVVVGARAQPVDLVLPAIASREDEYRVGLALVARLANDVEPGHFGQAEVDDREVDRVFEREIEPFAPVRRLFDRIARFGKLLRQRLAQGVVVFDNQQTHRNAPR